MNSFMTTLINVLIEIRMLLLVILDDEVHIWCMLRKCLNLLYVL